MRFYWIKTSLIVKKIFSKYTWDLPNSQNKIYLTFDDGPTPEVTEWVLGELKKYKARATFFCIGKNIKNYPSLFNKIITGGHTFGNHTFNHLNGWKTNTKNYIDNVALCAELILNSKNNPTTLFRPPYGKIKSKQARIIRGMGYKIIMWDVLSADFDQTISPQKCLENVISSLKPGSIIVFHDSSKAYINLQYTLPKVLDYIYDNKLICDSL